MSVIDEFATCRLGLPCIPIFYLSSSINISFFSLSSLLLPFLFSLHRIRQHHVFKHCPKWHSSQGWSILQRRPLVPEGGPIFQSSRTRTPREIQSYPSWWGRRSCSRNSPSRQSLEWLSLQVDMKAERKSMERCTISLHRHVEISQPFHIRPAMLSSNPFSPQRTTVPVHVSWSGLLLRSGSEKTRPRWRPVGESLRKRPRPELPWLELWFVQRQGYTEIKLVPS